MGTMKEPELSFRITVLGPPSGVLFGLQRDRSALVSPTRSTGAPITFDFTARVIFSSDSEYVDFRGPFVQGPKGTRFVYVNSGTSAGDRGSCWSRRAKVSLAGITASLAHKCLTTAGAQLEAVFQGTGTDGGPACASVKLLEPGWVMGK
jgi:hypothetical protein